MHFGTFCKQNVPKPLSNILVDTREIVNKMFQNGFAPIAGSANGATHNLCRKHHWLVPIVLLCFLQIKKPAFYLQNVKLCKILTPMY